MGIRLKTSKSFKIASIGLVSSRNCKSAVVILVYAGLIEALVIANMPPQSARSLVRVWSSLASRLHALSTFHYALTIFPSVSISRSACSRKF